MQTTNLIVARVLSSARRSIAFSIARAITPEIARETVAKLDEAPRLDARLDENDARWRSCAKRKRGASE